MKKSALIDLYAEATGMPKSQSAEYLARLGDIMATELLAGGEVPLPGIGTLQVRSTAARPGRNPKTGAAIQIPAGRKVAFATSAAFKASLK